MAKLKVFGKPGCVKCEGVKQYLARAGQSVRVGDATDSEGFQAAVKKALASFPVSDLVLEGDTKLVNQNGQSMKIDALAANLTKHPEMLAAPLVVRGNQVVVANRQEQAGALRY